MASKWNKHKYDCVAERNFESPPLGQTREEKDNSLKTQVPELMTTVISRYRDRPHNVNELQSVLFYVLVVDQLLESQHTLPLTWLMNLSPVPITWFSLAPGWGIPGELSVQTRSYPLEKKSSLVLLRKKLPCICMIQVPTHQDDMTCIDFYLDDTSPLHPPCLVQCMCRDWEVGSREVQTSLLPYLHCSRHRLESDFTG